MKIFLIGAIIFSVISSCGSSQDTTFTYFQKEIFSHKIGGSILIIIPAKGCQGCIKTASKFAIDWMNTDGFNTVITSGDRKELNYFHLNQFQRNTSIKMIDKRDLEQLGLSSGWPIALFFENKSLVKTLVMDARNIHYELSKIAEILKTNNS